MPRDETIGSPNDPFDMRSSQEPDDLNEKARQERALWCEKYYLTFSSPTGHEVLEHMKKRAFFGHPVMLGNPPQHVREAREGMRMFVLETEGFIDRHIKGTERGPLQKQALSDTAEDQDASR